MNEEFNPNEHLMDLKGKAYLRVMWRLVWFRKEKPNWCIDTKLEQLTDNHAVFSAKIFDENCVQKSAGYGSESSKDFKDFIEKAETKAVGRALAMLGYGTQFAPEMDEEERIVDSPVQRENDYVSGGFAPQCADCTEDITPREHDYSVKKYGRPLCRNCQRAAEEAAKADLQFRCEQCGEVLKPYIGVDGKEVSIRKHAEGSRMRFNGALFCIDCIMKAQQAGQAIAAAQEGE